MQALEQLVACVTERRPRVLPGAPGSLAGCFSWEALGRCLASDRLEPAQVTIVKHGATLHPSRFTEARPGGRAAVVPHVIEGLIAEGAVLLLTGVHRLDRTVWDLARRIEAKVENVVSANIYAGAAGSAGFGLHVDHHDVVVLQVAGRKAWEIYEPTYPDPIVLPDHMRGEPTRLVWSGVLEDGQALYLPRGFWHRARGTDEGRTLHVSFGIEPCTGLHLLGWLRDRLLDSDTFRADIPRFGSPEERRRHAEALRAEVVARLDAQAIDTYLAHRYDRVRRQTDELAARLWKDEGAD